MANKNLPIQEFHFDQVADIYVIKEDKVLQPIMALIGEEDPYFFAAQQDLHHGLPPDSMYILFCLSAGAMLNVDKVKYDEKMHLLSLEIDINADFTTGATCGLSLPKYEGLIAMDLTIQRIDTVPEYYRGKSGMFESVDGKITKLVPMPKVRLKTPQP